MEGRSPTHNRNERSGGNSTRKSNQTAKERSNNEEDVDPIGYQAIVLDPNPKAVCQLLALAVEHVDTLLEDWYPSLGTRFLHTSEGKMLVTRLVPCPRCLTSHNERESTKSWQDWSFLKKLQPQQQQQQQQ